MNARAWGVVVAFSILIIDQASKIALLEGLDLEFSGPITLSPYIDLILVWNRGISYGLFQQHADLGRYMLIAISLLASIGFALWLQRSTRPIPALALGCLIGGALGNAVDRILRGAVADFVLLHWGEWTWYVFNIADVAIVIGVALLLADSWLGKEPSVIESAKKE